MTEIITYEYLPYIEQVVYVKYEVIEKNQVIPIIGERKCLWGKWSWSNASIGPWEEFRSMLFGGFNP
jgi:hypothetical protein